MARPSPDGREGRGPASDHRSTGYEPFAAEHHRHDPPAESVEEQQRRSEADGEGERRVDHVERDERRHRDRQETRQCAELRRGSVNRSVIRVEIAARSRSTSRGDVEGEDLPNPGAGSAGDGGGKDDGRDGHAGGRCGIGSAEPVPGAQLAGVEGLPAGARGVYMPRSQQSLRKPSRGRWTRMAGRPGATRSPVNPGARPAASPALADLVPPWVRLRDHHHIMAGTFPPYQRDPPLPNAPGREKSRSARRRFRGEPGP
jgi:hypothetical protein